MTWLSTNWIYLLACVPFTVLVTVGCLWRDELVRQIFRIIVLAVFLTIGLMLFVFGILSMLGL